MNKKGVLRKTVLIYDWNKKYYTKSQNKKEISTSKTDYFFNTLAILKVDRIIFWLRDKNHNYNVTLLEIYTIYQKTMKIKEILESIANYAKTSILF